MNTIGNKIRLLREEKGFSQENLASALDITQSNYARLEKDDCVCCGGQNKACCATDCGKRKHCQVAIHCAWHIARGTGWAYGTCFTRITKRTCGARCARWACWPGCARVRSGARSARWT